MMVNNKRLWSESQTKFNEFWIQKCFTSSFLGQIGSDFGSDGSDEKQSDPQSDPRFLENFKN